MAKKITNFSSPPIIYNFHPDEFETVETESEIREFEELMRKSVKIKGFQFSGQGSHSVSKSGGRKDDCDDIVENPLP